MQNQLDKYSGFYKNKHTNRRLEFDHALGGATLKGRFREAPKDLTVSLYQAIILLQFNDTPELSFKYFQQHMRIGQSETPPSPCAIRF